MPKKLPTKSPNGGIDYSKSLINARDEMFCQAYIETFNASEAYLAAFKDGKKSSAAVMGCKILKRPDIIERLRYLSAKHVEKQEERTQNLIEHLYDIASLDPIIYSEINEEGEPVIDLGKILELTPRQRSLLKIEFGVGLTKDGERIKTYKVTPHDKMDAIEKILKLHQLYKGEDLSKQPMAIQVNVNVPIPGQSWRNNSEQTDQLSDSEQFEDL